MKSSLPHAGARLDLVDAGSAQHVDGVRDRLSIDRLARNDLQHAARSDYHLQVLVM